MTDQRVTNYRSSVSGKRAKKAKRRPKTAVTGPVTSSADTDTSGADPAATDVETHAEQPAETTSADDAPTSVAAPETKKPKKRKKRSRAITRAKITTSTTRRGNGTRR